MSTEVRDFRHVDPIADRWDGWRELMRALDEGHRCQVSHGAFWYFLEILPPRWMGRGAFVFAEGEEPRPYWFESIYGEHFAQRMTWDEIRARIRHPTGQEV